MTMHIRRTLPPAAAPIPLTDIVKALPFCLHHDVNSSGFEKQIKQDFKQRHCFLVSSGKAALTLILKTLSSLYPERDEVLIPAFTCYSVPAAIKKAGLKIKLCDTGPDSFDYEKKELRNIIEKDRRENKILCVLVTHLFGCAADFDVIEEIVGEKIPIVEDAAQAMGGEIKDKKIGTLGDVGFFSLGRGKPLSTMEGGVIVTSREDVGEELTRLLKNLETYSVYESMKLAAKTILTALLQHPFIFWLPKSLPFLRLGETIYEENFSIYRMSFFQQGLARNWRQRLKGHQIIRRKNKKLWQDCLSEKLFFICSRQNETSLIRLPVLAQSVEMRDKIYLQSEERGCGIMPAYPTPINEVHQITEEFVGQRFPNAKRLAECLLTLPVHEFVHEGDRIKIKNLTQ